MMALRTTVDCVLHDPEPTKQDNYIRYRDPTLPNRNLVFVPVEWFGGRKPDGRLTLTFVERDKG